MLAGRVLEVLREVCGDDRPVPLHAPVLGEQEIECMVACLRSGWISTVGEASLEFERRLQEITGVPHAVAVVNGTAALQLALLVAGVERGDEVLIPTLTFVATANAVHYCGAVPHFVDSEPRTLGVDAVALRDQLSRIARQQGGRCVDRETGRTIRALVAVHVFGHPVEIPALQGVCEEFGISLIEDAAEALGSFRQGVHVGGFGRVAALSFNGNKIVTTGGGGAILTRDAELAARVRHLSTTARVPHRWEAIHDQIGFNYRLPAINAALGNAQLEQLPDFLRRKRALALRWAEAFEAVEGVGVLREQPGVTSNYWLNTLLLDRRDRTERDEILRLSNEDGIGTRPAWTLLHQLPIYADCPRMPLPAAEALADRIVSLPSSASLIPAHGA